MAQLVEHILGKDEVPGPNPGSSSRHPRGNNLGALAFYRAFFTHPTLSKNGVSGAATLALERALHLGAESGSHYLAPRDNLRQRRISGFFYLSLTNFFSTA